MVIEGGAADVRGVKLGSKVVKINAIDVMSKPYLEVTPPPPPPFVVCPSLHAQSPM